MFGKRWDHPGKKEISLSIKGITPTMRIVVDPAVDGPTLADSLTRRLKECVESSIRESVDELLEYRDYGLIFECTREEFLLSASEYQAQHDAFMQLLREEQSIYNATTDAEIDNNPDNGKHGMWLVSGIRHSCLVNGVSTARDALNKALASGDVGSWEDPMAKFIDPKGPEVVPV